MARVLFVFNTAGASTPVADWLNENGHDAIIIMSTRDDPYGLTSGSESALMVDDPRRFHITIREQIREFKPTHIHVNETVNGLTVARAMSPSTPIVFQYHGTDVRGRYLPHLPVLLLSDKVVVSTSDLSRYGEWYDCPISSEFHYRGGRTAGTAVTVITPSIRADFDRQCTRYADEKELDLTVIDNRKGVVIPHSEMPEFLSRFEYYLDFKGVRTPGTLSLVAKEALAVGCKVIHDSDLTAPISGYATRTGKDYLELYLGLAKPPAFVTAVRLAYALPRSWPFLH